MKKLMSFVWMCLMSISMLSAQGVEEVTLVVSGDGATKEEATHVALRSAIEQAFGCFVSANTEILNDSLVKDEIVTISNGSISSYEEINVTELDSVLLSVTLRATVSVNKLISYAKSKGSSCELSGALLTQEKRMLEMNIANTKKALNHLFTLVNEFVAKNDLYTYTLDIQNVQIDGLVKGFIICKLNENGDNLIKMMNNYLSSISIDEKQVEHLEEIGFEVPYIGIAAEANYILGYRTYADFSCVSQELRQSIQHHINCRTTILIADNLGFVYPEIPRERPASFFDSHSHISLELESGEFCCRSDGYAYLKIPEQNMEKVSNIDIVPFSDSRFYALLDSTYQQAGRYSMAHQDYIVAHQGKMENVEEAFYYFYDKLGLYYSLVYRLISHSPNAGRNLNMEGLKHVESLCLSSRYEYFDRDHSGKHISRSLYWMYWGGCYNSVKGTVFAIERLFLLVGGKEYYNKLDKEGLDIGDGKVDRYILGWLRDCDWAPVWNKYHENNIYTLID